MAPRLLRSRLSVVAEVALLVGGLAAAPGGSAHARAELSGMEVAEVREAEHALAVHIDGLLASIDTRQVLVNQGGRDTEVIYGFDLPDDAAVIGAEVLLSDGRHALSAAVDVRAAFRFVPENTADSGAPDIGLLRLLDVDEERGVARYELRIFPVAAGRSATAVVHWVAPLRYRDGRLTLRLPDRGGAPNLVRERIDLVWRAPAGARGLRNIRSGPHRLAAATGPASGRLRFDAPVDGDLVLEAVPLFQAEQGLVAGLALVPLDRSRGAVALSLLSPQRSPSTAARFERVVLVVDRSASLGPAGLAAARAIADAMLGAANREAVADAVVFDRRARAVAGQLTVNRPEVQAGLARALAGGGPPANGSDLGAALAQVAGLLRRHGPAADAPLGELARGLTSSTLIVILTDGLLPLDLDGEHARAQLGTAALAEAKVASIVLVPDGAPAPDLERGPLAELARATGGRVLAVRNGDATLRAPQLWSEVGQPSPFDGIQIDWRGAVVTSDAALPGRLESGEGVLLSGFYHGARPEPVAVRAELRGRPLRIPLRAARGALARAALPLALVRRPAVELLPPGALGRGDRDERARAELLRTAHRAGVATGSTALVVLDPKDGFARDRLAQAHKWGPGLYLRFPPPAERRLGEISDARQEPRPASPVSLGAARAGRPTGELDKFLVERLMKQHMVPAARACYQQTLRREPKLAGTVVIELAMARGEVQQASVARSTAPSALLSKCLLDAAYATPVPRVALGDASEAIVVARYPLRFRRTDSSIDVGPTDDRPGTPLVDPNDPLGGL